jgi:hypothetical protein
MLLLREFLKEAFDFPSLLHYTLLCRLPGITHHCIGSIRSFVLLLDLVVDLILRSSMFFRQQRERERELRRHSWQAPLV